MTAASLLRQSAIGAPDAATQRQYNRMTWWIAYLLVCGVGLLIGLVGFKRSGQLYLGLSLALLTVLLAAWVRFPRTALAATIGLTLISDLVTVSWFPYLKNFSSFESITYLSDGASISPFELTLIWAVAVTGFRNLAAIGRPFQPAPLMRPLFVLFAFTLGALAYGLSRGGDGRIAIIEARPLFYLPFVYLLVVNVCHTFTDYRRVFYAAIGGIVVQSLISVRFLLQLPPAYRDDLESLNEHGSSIGMNLVFTMAILSLILKGVSWRLRFGLLAAVVPVLWIYLAAQRRAAVVALVAALIIFTIILFWRQRRTFWKVVPIGAIVVIGYVGAFWSSESSAGFPAQAVKSVIAPNSMSEKDQSSNEYRRVENFNLSYTIRSAPITGLGFGQPFLRPVQLPDISGFEFNAYLPHNSLLWIWIKLGFGGFVTVLYLLARSLSLGARRIREAPLGLDLLVASNAAMFVVMYSVYIFVDVAWEARNVTLLGLAMGLCTAYLVREGPTEARRVRPAATDEPVLNETDAGSERPVPAGARIGGRPPARPPTRAPDVRVRR
jgi:hypothetical protein